MQPTFLHRPLHLSRSLIRKTRTSTARSATFAEAAERPNSQLYDRRKVLPFRNSIESRCPWDFRLPLRNRSYAPSTKKGEVDPVWCRCERKTKRQNHIQSKNAKLFRKLLTGILAARCSLPAAVALGIAVTASLLPETAHAQEYPWCVSRESYLYCFYETQEQCQWTASGIGGCALNPRLLFPNKPRDSRPKAISRSKTY